MRVIPEPQYEYDIRRLKLLYQRSAQEILRQLERMDVTSVTSANSRAMLASISKNLTELDAESKAWVQRNIPLAARDGIARSLVALGSANSLEEALRMAEFNRLNRALVSAAVADTQRNLLAMSTHVDRKVRTTVQQVVAESMRENYAAGTHGRNTIRRDIVRNLHNKLGESIEGGLRISQRRWKPEVYADMVVRTKMMETYNEATANEAITRGAFYAVISSHNASDACRFHEGRIIKLTADAPGNYPTYAELRETGQIWHPNCRHTYTPLRSTENLPQSVRTKAEIKAIEGDKAIATGKRNPTGLG